MSKIILHTYAPPKEGETIALKQPKTSEDLTFIQFLERFSIELR